MSNYRLNESEPTCGVTCKHGSMECGGKVQQLCVAKYRPLKMWWSYVMCQNFQGKDRIENVDVALKCARTSGIDWETSDVGQCAGLDGSGTGAEDIQLLKESVQVTQSLGIVYDLNPLKMFGIHLMRDIGVAVQS